jgi:uroporphyrinogen decarboxylase
MNSRQRLQAAIGFTNPDRVPFDLGSSDVTGIHVQAYAALCAALGLEEYMETLDPLQGLARVSNSIRDTLGIDTAGVWLNPTLTPAGQDKLYDEWGTLWRRPEVGLWYEPYGFPLQQADLQAVAAHRWPDPGDPRKLAGTAAAAESLAQGGKYGIVANFSGALLARAQLLCGPADFLANLLAEPDVAASVLDRILEVNLALVENFLHLTGRFIDVIKVSDDLGSQANPLISPALYRRSIKPRQARFFELIHRLTSAKIMYHTCGAVAPLIDDFIEIGVDILNPIQAGARGMDTGVLGPKYRRRLVFWGAVDNQGVLSHPQPEAVAPETARRIGDLASPEGGYVMASSHNLQPGTRPEVLLALSRAKRTLEE